MSLLEVRDLTVRDSLTGALIVRDVHFCLERGTCLGVVGESGSGKSLTCLALLGLAPPSLRVSGSVRFGGIDLLQAGRETVRGIRGKRIAMIVQQPMTAFDPLYSMGAQLLETLRATTSAFSEKESRGRIVEALEMMHIHNPLDVLKKYPYQLSGGMLQRCMIAVALLQRPDIIIADEPYGRAFGQCEVHVSEDRLPFFPPKASRYRIAFGDIADLKQRRFPMCYRHCITLSKALDNVALVSTR